MVVKKIALPDCVTVCGIDYKIEVKENLICEGGPAYGACLEEECVIRLKSGLSKQRLSEVLLHETLHAISNETSIDLSETQVHNLAIQLLDVIKRNELFRKVLIG